MRVLVTGANGFTGKALMPYLMRNGYEVFGFSKHAEGVNQFKVDLLDSTAVSNIIEQISPDVVFHLAGIALPGFTDVELMYKINMFGTKNVLDAIQIHKPDVKKVILASTAHVYGITNSTPVKESHRLAPVSHYGNSKLSMENIANLYMDKLPIIIARPFNYTGKGQSTDYVIAKIIEHYIQKKSEITLGNIDVVRDFSHIDDVLYYYLQLMQVDQSGFALNLCSGVGSSIRQIIEHLDQIVGYEMKVNSSNTLLRPQDNPVFIGDVSMLEQIVHGYERTEVKSMLIKLLSE